MKTLVERIRNRELAIENDGSLEELRKVLEYCFPEIKSKAIGNSKYYLALQEDKSYWVGSVIKTGLTTVSVKEVLAEIEGEGKETKVIYLNEEDRPKIEEPLSLKDFIRQKQKGSIETNYSNTFIKINGFTNLDKLGFEWLTYRNNFNSNDKPIEFTNYYEQNSGKLSPTPYTANDFDIVVYAGNGFFWCTDKDGEGTVSVFKGNLNNGKVK